MDVFVEQIVKKHNSMVDMLKIVGVIVAAIILSYVFVFILPALYQPLTMISFFLVAGAVFGAYWLITQMDLEFEYAVTNGDVTVDKIIHRRARKRVLTVDAKDVEKMGKFKERTQNNGQQKKFDKEINAARDLTADDCYYMEFRHQKFGQVFLTFSPDERTLNAIKPFLKRQLALEVFGRDAFRRT